MAEENGGKRTGLLDRVRGDAEEIKKIVREKGKEEIEGLKDPEKTQLYRSIFRVKHEETPRSRSLGVLSNVFLHLHPAKVNRDATRYNYTWGMGGITFYLFIVLTFTGVLLMFYLIIAVWLHMFRVFLTGSYKKPREFNWCVGVLLMVLTLLLSFTGYLLPDDQLGFWAVTVGTNMARATPGLGHEGPFGSLLGMTPYNDVRFALLGGSIVDANALLRAYIWHCIAIPLIASVFMGVHFWRVRKDGGISGPSPVMLESEIKEDKGPRPVILRPSGMV